MGLIGRFFGRSNPDGEHTFRDLRQRVLGVRAAELGLEANPDSPIFGVVMETGMKGSVATFVCLADGTVSLYLSTGGGVIGGGQHESVRSAATEFLGITNEYGAAFIEACQPGIRQELPRNGRVHFNLLTHMGAFSTECSESALAAQEDPFSALFNNCHAVLAEVREIEQAREH